MRDGADRRPGAVVDDEDGRSAFDDTRADVRGGDDTDGDGHPDTLLAPDGPDLLVLTDLDGDGLADRVLRIGPDGSVHAGHPGLAHLDVWHGEVQQIDAAYDTPDAGTGSAPAHTPWSALLGHLFGP